MLVHGAGADVDDLSDVAVRLAARNPQKRLGLALRDRQLPPEDSLPTALSPSARRGGCGAPNPAALSALGCRQQFNHG